MNDDLPARKPQGDALMSAVSRALEAQRDFEQHRPTRMGRGVESMAAPIGAAVKGVVPPAMMRAALRGADTAAGLTLRREIAGHDLGDIDACDAAALSVQKWAMGTNAASGGLAGWFGGLGLTLDIPATLTMAARNVRATGIAYGFDGDDERERAFRLMILELAAVRGLEARSDALGRVNALARRLSDPVARAAVAQAGDWVLETLIERVGRQLGISLLRRKAAQIVPIAGGVVAAGINASFQTDVSRAARYAYRQRWLMGRKLLPAPQNAPEANMSEANAPEAAPTTEPAPETVLKPEADARSQQDRDPGGRR
ncbi:EcsC family protein [Brevirhabdus sp.]|uniref:EcsC family protein n=1 Tax=Brevirhabdus sp. TaxID=2004514 RepID=UPI0040587956